MASRTVRRQGKKSNTIPGSTGKNGKTQNYRYGPRSIYRHRARIKAQKAAQAQA